MWTHFSPKYSCIGLNVYRVTSCPLIDAVLANLGRSHQSTVKKVTALLPDYQKQW